MEEDYRVSNLILTGPHSRDQSCYSGDILNFK